MAVLTKTSGTAYATKGNILFPGSAADAATVQANAAVAANDEFKSAPSGVDATPSVTAPSIDSGDLVVEANLETTKYNQDLAQ